MNKVAAIDTNILLYAPDTSFPLKNNFFSAFANILHRQNTRGYPVGKEYQQEISKSTPWHGL